MDGEKPDEPRRKFEEALRRIDEGKFGICEEHGLEVSIERLEALPYATRCIECKREQEKESPAY